MRFEANVSVRPIGSSVLNPRHEIKNLNSFRALSRSVAYEIEQQSQDMAEGNSVVQQTMGWDEVRGVTIPQRGKEQADDYRYFPEPDLPAVEISREMVERLRSSLPELPDDKRARFTSSYGLGDYDAGVLVADRAVADYFEAAVEAGQADPKTVANWVTGELFRLLNETSKGIANIPIQPQALAEMVEMVAHGTISSNAGKEVLAQMAADGRGAREVVAALGLAQISDEDALGEVITGLLDESPEQVRSYLGGRTQVIGWLIGQVMKATRGKANPQLARRLLQAQLEARKQ
jgi:aspartyl-tRNA(Asn)/glutamyl-tRNA(Gln) amidotransferase subunit B